MALPPGAFTALVGFLRACRSSGASAGLHDAGLPQYAGDLFRFS